MKKIVILHEGTIMSFSSEESLSYESETITSEEDNSKTSRCANECCNNSLHINDVPKHIFAYNYDEFWFCKECIGNAQQLCEQIIRYDNETYLDKIKRARDSKEWYFREYNDKVAIDDVDCLYGGDTCWFHGNLDRLQEYNGCYSLKGTECLISMCRVCWGNSSLDEEEIERVIKHNFRTEIDKDKIYNEIYARLYEKMYSKMTDEKYWKYRKDSLDKRVVPKCLLFNYNTKSKCKLDGKNKNVSYREFIFDNECLSQPKLFLCQKCWHHPDCNTLLEPVCDSMCRIQAKSDMKYI